MITMKKFTRYDFLLIAFGTVQQNDNSADIPWWVISLIGLGVLFLIWLTRNKPGWEWDGPTGCPTEIAKSLGILFALALLIFGIIGAFDPRALIWLENGLSLLGSLVSAWEIMIGLVILGVFVYFLVIKSGYRVFFRRQDLEQGEGCSFVFWTTLIIWYIYWIISTGRWVEFIEPFIKLIDK